MPRWLSSLLLALSLLGSLNAQTKPLTQQQVDTRVEKLLGQMTLDEKIGQMTQIPGRDSGHPGQTGRTDSQRSGRFPALAHRSRGDESLTAHCR